MDKNVGQEARGGDLLPGGRRREREVNRDGRLWPTFEGGEELRIGSGDG